MKVRLNNQWEESVDYDPEDKVVIRVTKWICLAPVQRAYFSYPLSPKILWHYRSIGLKNIARKITSRRKNDAVSQKFVSIGKGIVEKAEDDFNVGDAVVFIAPNHPEGLTRIALEPDWVRWTTAFEKSETKWAKLDSQLLSHLGGFELESGNDRPNIESAFSKIEACFSDIVFSETIEDFVSLATSRMAKPTRVRKKINKVTIFGWGHHSRTQISQNIPVSHTLTRVHDIDPLVLKLADESVSVDTRRRISIADDSDVVIVAGYHHTHTDLVLEALRLGKVVICEKPLATSWEQFTKLEKLTEPRLVMAYHRRYDPFFETIREDLSPKNTKIDYRCIVHEVSLPKNHWYNWPVSKSKIVSNGCHWIDHFLALKPGLEVVDLGAFKNEQGLHCNLTLEDGSTFNMLLSDKGSDAKGNREEIHIHVGEKSVFIKDFETYTFSNIWKKVRQEKAKKLEVFPRMYDTIFKNIVDAKFDDFSEVLRTQSTLLKLHDQLTM